MMDIIEGEVISISQISGVEMTEEIVTYRWNCPLDEDNEPVCGVLYHDTQTVTPKGSFELTVDSICPLPPNKAHRVHLVFVERIKDKIQQLMQQQQ